MGLKQEAHKRQIIEYMGGHKQAQGSFLLQAIDPFEPEHPIQCGVEKDIEKALEWAKQEPAFDVYYTYDDKQGPKLIALFKDGRHIVVTKQDASRLYEDFIKVSYPHNIKDTWKELLDRVKEIPKDFLEIKQPLKEVAEYII